MNNHSIITNDPNNTRIVNHDSQITNGIHNSSITNNSKGLTLVTYLYDLNSRGANSRSMDFYFNHGKWVLSLNQNLVIWCDPTLVERIYESRKKFGLIDKTMIISLPFKLLKYYILLESRLSSVKKPTAMDGTPLIDSSSYISLTWNKLHCLKQTIKMNPFMSTHYMWIDFGLFYVAKPVETMSILYQIFKDYPDKLRSMMIYDTSLDEIKHRNIYYSAIHPKMAGGLFIGPEIVMKKFIKLFELELEKMFQSGWHTNEETIFGAIYAENRSLFNPYYGDYEHIVGNYFDCYGRINTLFKNLVYCRCNNLHQITFNVTKWMEKGYIEGKLINLTAHDIFGLYDEMFIAACFLNQNQDAIYAGNKMIESINKYPKEIGNRVDQRFINNLKLVGLNIPNQLLNQ